MLLAHRDRSVRVSACQQIVGGRRFFCQDRAAMPENLRRVMEDYERQIAAQEASRGRFSRLMQQRYAGLVGMGLAGILAWAIHTFDDVTCDVHKVFGKLLSSLDPSSARSLLVGLAAKGLLPRDYDKDDPYLVIEPEGSGLRFMTPVGLAAGIDRDALGVSAFVNLGFGFVEVGPVSATAAIDALVDRLDSRDTAGQVFHGILGVLICGSTVTELRDRVVALSPHVDYLAVDLAKVRKDFVGHCGSVDVEALRKLVGDIVGAAARHTSGDARLFFRVPASWPEAGASPAVRRAALAALGAAALAGGAMGLIICHREIADGDADEASHQLQATEAIGEVYRHTSGRLVLVACGGVETGRDALERIEAGATVVQITSTLLFNEGPQACRRIKNELSTLLMNEGYVNLQDAVGVAHRKQRRGRRRNPWRAKDLGAA